MVVLAAFGTGCIQRLKPPPEAVSKTVWVTSVGHESTDIVGTPTPAVSLRVVPPLVCDDSCEEIVGKFEQALERHGAELSDARPSHTLALDVAATAPRGPVAPATLRLYTRSDEGEQPLLAPPSLSDACVAWAEEFGEVDAVRLQLAGRVTGGEGVDWHYDGAAPHGSQLVAGPPEHPNVGRKMGHAKWNLAQVEGVGIGIAGGVFTGVFTGVHVANGGKWSPTAGRDRAVIGLWSVFALAGLGMWVGGNQQMKHQNQLHEEWVAANPQTADAWVCISRSQMLERTAQGASLDFNKLGGDDLDAAVGRAAAHFYTYVYEGD